MQKNKLILLSLMLLSAPTAHAEHGDSDQPVNIEADRVVMDNATRISTFEGRVQMTQGTLVIRADKVVVVQDEAGMKHGTAYGHTASFRQKRDGLDEYVEGFAERIEYDMNTDVVDFYGQARVKRSQDDVRGEHITYNAKTETFQAGGNKAAGGESTRVHAVLHPKSKTQDGDPAGESPATKPGKQDRKTERK